MCIFEAFVVCAYVCVCVQEYFVSVGTCMLVPLDVVVCWLLNIPATCLCISGANLLRQFYVLPDPNFHLT